MKLGTQIRLPDGREATAVYNGLDGVGIMFGLHTPDPADFESREDFKWEPEAMLREPYDSATLPCVGEEYIIIKESHESDN